jgi:ketosteroid isomerase-like protein
LGRDDVRVMTFERSYATFSSGDIPWALATLADDIVWHVPGRRIEGGKAVEFRQFQGDQQAENEFWSL